MSARPASGWSLLRRAVLVGVVVAAVLGLGVYAGLRSPWGTKHPQAKQGTAVRANEENDLVLFDAGDGTQLAFHADGIWWESASRGGQGDPPCLRKPLAKVEVEVGVIRIAGPDGGWRQQAAWVKCPS
jgi:hypothetical protein